MDTSNGLFALLLFSFVLHPRPQQQRFNQMSTTIIGRIDDMGGRIDELEKSIADLMQQAGIDAKGSLDGDDNDK